MAEAGPAAKRVKALSAVAACGWCPKSSLGKILATLSEFDACGTARQGRREVAEAVLHHATAMTPYGPVVQQLDFSIDQERTHSMAYIHPFALIFYLCSLNSCFGALLRDCLRNRLCRIVMYIDEIKPGNVLRPDKGRATPCVYWTFLEFPEWFRRRAIGWMSLAFVRTAIVLEFPGQVSGLMRALLHKLFSSDGHHFQRTGVNFLVHGCVFNVRAEFAGFLGDEKALK